MITLQVPYYSNMQNHKSTWKKEKYDNNPKSTENNELLMIVFLAEWHWQRSQIDMAIWNSS